MPRSRSITLRHLSRISSCSRTICGSATASSACSFAALPTLALAGIVTVYEDSDRIFQALRAGACGYLLKRAKPERIIAAIQEAQEGGVPMTPEIARKVIGSFREQAVASSESESLSPREKEVLQLVMHGLGNKEIAERLGR